MPNIGILLNLKHVYKMASILKEDLTSHDANVTSERVKGSFLPPSLMKTQKIVEDNENNRGQKYTL